MKKLVLALVCASSLAYGQQIPNGDFEDWGTSPESFILFQLVIPELASPTQPLRRYQATKVALRYA